MCLLNSYWFKIIKIDDYKNDLFINYYLLQKIILVKTPNIYFLKHENYI